MNLKFHQATSQDLETIRNIAYASWPIAYGQILSAEQLHWMLEKFYCDDALYSNFENNQIFYIVSDDSETYGFFAIEYHYKKISKTRLHKLYFYPSAQGKGIGKIVMAFIENKAIENSDKIISLNVNKFNSAIEFYKKMNFEIVSSEIIAIGNGYVMDDYQMEKGL